LNYEKKTIAVYKKIPTSHLKAFQMLLLTTKWIKLDHIMKHVAILLIIEITIGVILLEMSLLMAIHKKKSSRKRFASEMISSKKDLRIKSKGKPET
jgi:hypothetical protein